MASRKKEYTIHFCIQKPESQISNNKLSIQNCQLKEEFTFTDYYSKKSTQSVKDYFLSFFGFKYKYCICQLILCKKEKEEYIILKNKYLNELNNLSELYLINTKNDCECQLKDYIYYFSQNKSSLIQDLISYKTNLKEIFKKYIIINDKNKKEYEILKDLNSRISKLHEIDNLKDDDFYDVVIDIKSMKSIIKGWKIKMSEEGKENYDNSKNEKLLKIGVIGNSKRGK